MQLFSADKTHVVRLSVAEIEDAYPSRKLVIAAQLDRFAGDLEVWVEQPALEGFVGALQALAETRKGRAELRSMSPEEMHLTISTHEPPGNLLFEIAIVRHVYVGDRFVDDRLSGGFELDPAALGTVVQDFRKLSSERV